MGFRTSQLISNWNFPKGELEDWEYGRRKFFRRFSSWSLTRKPTYNKTCNPTYNPSHCPHTSVVARGGTTIGTFWAAETRLGKHRDKGERAQKGKRGFGSRENLLVVIKVFRKL